MNNGLDKRSLLAFAIIGLLALFMSTDTYRRLVGMPTSDELAARAAVEAEAREAALLEAELPLDRPADPPQRPLEQDLEIRPEAEPTPWADFEEQLVRIETERYISTLSTRGASIVRHELKGLTSYYGETVVLIDEGQGNLELLFDHDGRNQYTADLPFSLVAGTDRRLQPGEETELVFEHVSDEGARIEKRYRFSGDSYRIDYLPRVEAGGRPLRRQTWSLRWNTGMQLTEPDPEQDNFYTEALVLAGSEVGSFRLGRKEEAREERRKGTIHWVAARTKYFEVAVQPLGQTAEQVLFEGRQRHIGEEAAHSEFSFELDMPLLDRDRISGGFAVYLGPLLASAMEDMDPSLQRSIMTKTSLSFFGFMWPVIRPFANIVLWVFTKLHAVISNFGVIIIVFSFLVKIVVWPLTHKSYASMKEMQKIRPLQEELKKKYANNPKKMQEETMRLFREHKVNPFGSCLPTLLQMPLLFSLYFVFRGAFELRGAYFFGWITDLSVPDAIVSLPFTIPLYGDYIAILPILFAASSYAMMRMTMTDPNQKALLYMMPVMMLFIFNQMPSGLTLYYTLFNLLSAGQQHLSKGMIENGAKPKPAAVKARK
jgi:YidC/Oxa1 family membrane protein insertase